MVSVRIAFLFSVFVVCVLAMSVLAQGSAQAQISQEPMIFFVAEGGPDACGPGCNDWIAADGVFDKGVEKRFRDFLGSLKGRKLPVFFNSPGGVIGEARVMGRTLREYRMTASVGITVPAACGAKTVAEKSCRKITQSRGSSKAQLRTSRAQCYSACVYALIGASVRKIPADSRLGIHAGRQTPESIALSRRPGAPTKQQLLDGRKRYVLELGADARLVDEAEKVPPTRLHVMNRNEIARLGVETSSAYETSWLPYEDRTPAKPLFMMKAVTHAKGAEGKEFVTSVLRLSCHPISPVTWIEYQRELATNEIGASTIVQVGPGNSGRTLFLSELKDTSERYVGTMGPEFVSEAIAAGGIVLTEAYSPKGAPSGSREIKISAAGLEQALKTPLKKCPGL